MRVLFIFTIFGYSLSCLGQTYSGTWTLEGDNLINSTQLSLDISPKRFFYDALGSINIPEGFAAYNWDLRGCKLWGHYLYSAWAGS